MLFAHQAQLFFQLLRDAGLSSGLFQSESRPQVFRMVLTDDTFCHFSIERIEDGLYLVSTSPAVRPARESQFVPTFEAALPLFGQWAQAIKQLGGPLFVPDVPLGGLREGLVPMPLDSAEPLSPDEVEGLDLVLSLALDLANDIEPDGGLRWLQGAGEDLRTQLHHYPRHHLIYMIVGFLRTHAAQVLHLHQSYEALAQIVVERILLPGSQPPE
ncbi:hypothetical protein [Hymenobacter cellulosivorans]|uniref:Uncharacterized protein n=1 Tax=Hymenobacter cellulosivorans TaxID=2932249 RepID=A0ABY4F7Z6_9BACT|nr:hypothetical protein [Hymenobacter cellulosivorans]UOQ52227.1 hypothetical protein MUN80_21000 [Hymenobacter cellulosivorans]